MALVALPVIAEVEVVVPSSHQEVEVRAVVALEQEQTGT
jgi:hypothetical protein